MIGWLQQNEINTHVINIPCECVDKNKDPLHREVGEALMPEIGKGKEWLKQFKQSYLSQEGRTAWEALYQGNPVADGGNLWRKDWWRYYVNPPKIDEGVLAMSIDATFKEGTDNDFCVIQMWLKKNDDYYLLEQLRKRMGFVDTIDAVRSLRLRYPDTTYIYIEDKANGSAIIDALSREFEGVIPVSPEGGKYSRAAAVSHIIETGHVWVPKFAGWLDEFLAETAAFPAGKHDDQVDAASQALNRLSNVSAATIPKNKRRYVTYTEDMLQDYDNATPAIQMELNHLWGYPKQYCEDEE